MKAALRALQFAALFFYGCVFSFAQNTPAQQPPTSAQQPPTIDESVPPAFDSYPKSADSQPNAQIPHGQVLQIALPESKIFPGTQHTISVYVPAQYHGDKPACVYVGFDGLGFSAATVFDNLIAQGAMPVTIAIGVSPGVVASSDGKANPRFDRSFEFDSRSDLLARFLVEEVLPEVEHYPSLGGNPIRLSHDPNDRAIGGGSTGAIAAFTVAWERPDEFRRVFSAIGTYVGMRGGEQYYVLVRKTEPKPIRIFMQDGVHDEWPGGPEMGDWWMSNLTMQRALEFAGYDVRHVWGAGTHNGSQAESLFPDAMRWLWRDYPTPVKAGAPGNPVLQEVLQDGETWQPAVLGCFADPSLAVNPQGQVVYAARGSFPINPIATTGSAKPCAQPQNAPIAFSSDGKLYVAQPEGGIRIAEHEAKKPAKILGRQLRVRSFVVRSNGDIYALTRQSQLWLVRASGDTALLDKTLKQPSSLALSPDGLWLMVAQSTSRAGISYRVMADGTVDARAPLYDFAVPAWSDESGASAVAMDRDGRAYVATTMGVQIFDRNGRVAGILPLPNGATATGLAFGGPDFSTLYVSGGGKIYRRKLQIRGAPAWVAPFALPPWGAG